MKETRSVSFRIEAPEAASVTIAGDFNEWNAQARPLRRRKDGVWWTVLRLRPGVYQYKFVLDGAQWKEDPINPARVQNEHGTYNSIYEVA